MQPCLLREERERREPYLAVDVHACYSNLLRIKRSASLSIRPIREHGERRPSFMIAFASAW
jgi:hypothetical protein